MRKLLFPVGCLSQPTSPDRESVGSAFSTLRSSGLRRSFSIPEKKSESNPNSEVLLWAPRSSPSLLAVLYRFEHLQLKKILRPPPKSPIPSVISADTSRELRDRSHRAMSSNPDATTSTSTTTRRNPVRLSVAVTNLVGSRRARRDRESLPTHPRHRTAYPKPLFRCPVRLACRGIDAA